MEYNIEIITNELMLISMLLVNLGIIGDGTTSKDKEIYRALLRRNRYICDILIDRYCELCTMYEFHQDMSKGYQDMADINRSISIEFFHAESEANDIYEVD